MIWSAFRATELLDLAFVATKMNSADNQDLHLATRYCHNPRHSKHQDLVGGQWCGHYEVAIALPDLNPMENLWAFLVCQIYGNNYQFNTVKGLQSALAKHGAK
uniref:DDE_3 domain-containing protein n=1 Tax=Heterorhabditis bacteriophora TaxID=37862 RepID=A0A1I7WJ77_HETBA